MNELTSLLIHQLLSRAKGFTWSWKIVTILHRFCFFRISTSDTSSATKTWVFVSCRYVLISRVTDLARASVRPFVCPLQTFSSIEKSLNKYRCAIFNSNVKVHGHGTSKPSVQVRTSTHDMLSSTSTRQISMKINSLNNVIGQNI